MSDPLYRLLRDLAEAGRLPASRFSARTWKALESLVEARVLGKSRSAGGLVVEVADAAVLDRFIRDRFPLGDREADTSPRARAVLELRNAKRAARTDREPVLIRAFHDTTCEGEGRRLDAAAITAQAGAVCLVLEEGNDWSLAGTLAVVENLECFLHFEAMGVAADAALYASGRFSNLVLRWLASDAMARCRLIHCGDYDPVGLCNYLRLKEAAPDRVSLHVPLDLEMLVRRFGRPELVRDSVPILKRLRESADPDVRRVVEILDATGLGLEQEALLGLSRIA